MTTTLVRRKGADSRSQYTFASYIPWDAATAKEYVTPTGDKIERVLDANLWDKCPDLYKFHTTKTKEVFYTSDPDPEKSYHAYLRIAKHIIVGEDYVERLPCVEEPGPCVGNFALRLNQPRPPPPYRYKSHKLKQVFSSYSADIYKSYQRFMADRKTGAGESRVEEPMDWECTSSRTKVIGSHV